MSLKDKVLKTRNDARCINCEHFELLDNKVAYCNKSDKLILDIHVDVVRKCDNYKKCEGK